MNYTNINISSPYGYMPYIIEYQNDDEEVDLVDAEYKYEVLDSRIDFYDPNINIKRQDNCWIPYEGVYGSQDYLPDSIATSSINLYFPHFSVDTYIRGVKYALTVNTWIHGHEVYLGSYIIDRKDAIAVDKIKKFNNYQYYEKINLTILDPWFMVFSDDWKEWRQNICGEEEFDNHELNNTGSVLNFTLHPVYTEGDTYNKIDNYIGGQNAINISDTVSDYIKYHIEVVNEIAGEIQLQSKLTFNNAYDQTLSGLNEYIKETYGWDDYYMEVDCVVMDSEDVYKAVQKEVTTLQPYFYRKEFVFDSWSEYTEGMRFRASFNIYDNDVDKNVLLSVISNEIPLTRDLAKFFVGVNKYNTAKGNIRKPSYKEINHIKLKLIDMKVNNLNVVNKIIKNIVQIERPNDYKSNIVKPVYFKTRDLANLIIHPAVTEYISINLDAYKSQVDSFILNIEGCSFLESGRVQGGVLFKVVGNSLPNTATYGTYYILNEDQEVITSGKYTYES